MPEPWERAFTAADGSRRAAWRTYYELREQAQTAAAAMYYALIDIRIAQGEGCHSERLDHAVSRLDAAGSALADLAGTTAEHQSIVDAVARAVAQRRAG